MMATPTPISSLLGASCASWASVAGELDLHAAGAGVRRRRPWRRASWVVGELVERVGDVEVGGLPVGAERGGLRRERVGDAGDVVPAGELRRGPARRSAAWSASSSRPSSVWSTMRADWPPWLGNRSFRTSAACWDSTPGTRSLLSNWPPALPCRATTATAATSQRPSTRNGCRALLRPRRYRNALTGSSWSGARGVRDDSHHPGGR